MHQDRRRVLIIGAGFAGRRCKKVLSADGSLSVTMIDACTWAEYTPSILRCLVEPDRIDSFLIPHAQPGFVHAVAEEVNPNPNGIGGSIRICHSDGRRQDMPFDFLIIATGSLYQLFKPELSKRGPSVLNQPSLSDRKRELLKAAKELEAARSIVIIGAGTVGVELAAEIAGHFVKRKKLITLVSSKPRVLDRMPLKASQWASQWLQRQSVEVVLDAKVTSTLEQGDGTWIVELSSGQRVQSDPCLQLHWDQWPAGHLIALKMAPAKQRQLWHSCEFKFSSRGDNNRLCLR